MPDQKFPGFIQHYLDKLEYEGLMEFAKLNRSFQNDLGRLDKNHNEQSRNKQAGYRNFGGPGGPLDQTPAIAAITESYKEKALELAKKFGYKEDIYDKDLTEKQENFIEGIERSKENTKSPKIDIAPKKAEQTTEELNEEQKRAKFLAEMKAAQEKQNEIEKKIE